MGAALDCRRLLSARRRGLAPQGPVVIPVCRRRFRIPDDGVVLDVSDDDLRAVAGLWVVIVCDDETIEDAIAMADRVDRMRPEQVEIANIQSGMWASVVENYGRWIASVPPAWEA